MTFQALVHGALCAACRVPLAGVAPASVLEGVAWEALAAAAIRAACFAPAHISVTPHTEARIEVEESRRYTALVANVGSRIYLRRELVVNNLDTSSESFCVLSGDLGTLAAAGESGGATCAVTSGCEPFTSADAVVRAASVRVPAFCLITEASAVLRLDPDVLDSIALEAASGPAALRAASWTRRARLTIIFHVVTRFAFGTFTRYCITIIAEFLTTAQADALIECSAFFTLGARLGI